MASPTEIPTTSSTVTPPSSPTPEATTTPAPDGRLAPLRLQDPGVLQSALSDAELACIGDDPETLTRALTGQGPTSQEEQAKLIGCINVENLARIFLAGFVPSPGPLSQETSDCVRAAFEVIDPRTVMTAGLEGDPGRAMAGSMAAMTVTIACLSDDEWAAVGPMTAMGRQERAGMRCLMEALGGPARMVEAVMASQEAYFTTYYTPEEALAAAKEGDAALNAAAAACEMDMGPDPGQAPTTPPPAPMVTAEAPTPVSTPGMTGPTPTATATTVPSTPTPTDMTILVITVAEVPEDIPDYDRSDWKYWVDEDGDCQDARQEVLITESLEPVTFETDRKRRVATGQWWAPHLGHHLVLQRQLIQGRVIRVAGQSLRL